MKKLFSLMSLVTAFTLFIGNTTFADGLNSIHTHDGNYVIAAGDAGNIFRSVNGGSTWAKYTELSINFKSVFTLGTNVWLSADNGTIYKSSVNSVTLTPYLSGVVTSVNSVSFIDASNGFACGDNGVVVKSVNGGTSWTPVNTGLPTTNFNSVSFKDASNGIVVGNSGIAYTTINGGSSWTLETTGTTRNLKDAKYYSDGIAIVGEWGTLLVKYGAAPWSAVATKINSDIRAIAGTSINETHICGGGGFIRNNKSSNTGFLNFEKNPMLANLVDITFANSNTGFAVSSLNNAIIRTVNGGDSWELPASVSVAYNWVSKPGASGNFLGNNMSLHPTDRNQIFIVFGNQVYKSKDKGETWSTVGNVIPSGSTPHSFFVSPLDTNIWLVAIQSSPDKVYRTTNYGQTWTTVISMAFSNYGQPLEMDQNNPHNFYFAPDNGGFYKSTDDGATFTNIFSSISGTGGEFRSPCDLLVQWNNSNTIFLADGVTSSGLAKLFKSVDGGMNWTSVHTNASSSEVPSMSNTVFDDKLIFATEWPGNNIYKSVNSGNSFVTNNSNSFSGWGSDICREDPTLIVTGSWGASATISLNGGSNWTTISSGLSGHGGGILVPDRGYIIAHQGNNVYKLNVQYTVITSVSENVITGTPNEFNLSQNYPNPFNPTTNIKFDIPNSGNVSLKVYNELGKEVNNLINSYRSAGKYEINFDATNLSSGIYFYKLETGDFTATKKMLLIK